jgi:hypothetical protein
VTRCHYSHIPDHTDPDDHYWHCEAEAGFTCCDFGGPVCEGHKCRCSRPLTSEQLARLANQGVA